MLDLRKIIPIIRKSKVGIENHGAGVIEFKNEGKDFRLQKPKIFWLDAPLSKDGYSIHELTFSNERPLFLLVATSEEEVLLVVTVSKDEVLRVVSANPEISSFNVTYHLKRNLDVTKSYPAYPFNGKTKRRVIIEEKSGRIFTFVF